MLRFLTSLVTLLLIGIFSPRAALGAPVGAAACPAGHCAYLPLMISDRPPAQIADSDFESADATRWAIRPAPRRTATTGARLDVTPHSGASMAVLDGGRAAASAIAQTVALPNADGQMSLYLLYYYQIRSAGPCDQHHADVTVRAANGRAVGRTYLLCAPNVTAGWQFAQLDITALAGQPATVEVQVAGGEAGSDVFYVDDLGLGALIPPLAVP